MHRRGLSCSGPSGAGRARGRSGWPLDVDLEVEVAADGAGVAGLADGADSLAGPDALAALDQRPGGAGGRRSSCAAPPSPWISR